MNFSTDEAPVKVKNFADVLAPLMKPHTHLVNGLLGKKKVGVIISGSGTNLQALIDHTQDPNKGSMAEIALVISNKAGVQGLRRAEAAGIKTLVISHTEYPSREDFDNVMTQALEKENIQLVCLAGFMRIVSPSFVRHWRGRLLNIHPSLLPSFKGAHAHQDVLEAGVRVTGCTVHFVAVRVNYNFDIFNISAIRSFSVLLFTPILLSFEKFEVELLFETQAKPNSIISRLKVLIFWVALIGNSCQFAD